jgi:hypothetical protein
LLWYADIPGERIASGAPSWSWASITAPVENACHNLGARENKTTSALRSPASVESVDEKLMISTISHDTIRYKEPCAIKIVAYLIRFAADESVPPLNQLMPERNPNRYKNMKWGPVTTGSFRDSFELTYELFLDVPIETPVQPHYVEMGFNAIAVGTRSGYWYYLIITPKGHESKNEWSRLGFLQVTSHGEPPPSKERQLKTIRLV